MISMQEANQLLRKIIGFPPFYFYVGHCGYNMDFGLKRTGTGGEQRGQYSILILCPSIILVKHREYRYPIAYAETTNEVWPFIEGAVVTKAHCTPDRHSLHLSFTNGVHLTANPQTRDPDYPETWNFYDDSGEKTSGFLMYENEIVEVNS